MNVSKHLRRYPGGTTEKGYWGERGMAKLKKLKREAAERERKLLETTSLGKLIK